MSDLPLLRGHSDELHGKVLEFAKRLRRGSANVVRGQKCSCENCEMTVRYLAEVNTMPIFLCTQHAKQVETFLKSKPQEQ